MPPMYDFVCSEGHQTEKFFHMNDTRPPTVECDWCGEPAKRVFSIAGVKPDFPEHYNWSLGCVVKSRKHHEQIQKERGLQDYEPCRNSPGSQLSKERM